MMLPMLRVIGALLLSVLLPLGAAAETLGYKGGAAESDEGEALAGEEVHLSDAEWYVRDVMLAIFYHELGHALIDVMQLPVLGLEEDAADVLSVVMIDRLWDAESSEAKVAAAATFWATSAMQSAEEGYEPAFWGVHSPDERRYFTYLCLYYGGAPEEREAMAVEFGLPEDRAASCPEEFDLAASSWGVYLDELEAAGPGKALSGRARRSLRITWRRRSRRRWITSTPSGRCRNPWRFRLRPARRPMPFTIRRRR